MKKIIFFLFIVSSWILFSAFNIDNAIVPKDKILSGGPPKDGIPAILNPKFVKSAREWSLYILSFQTPILFSQKSFLKKQIFPLKKSISGR